MVRVVHLIARRSGVVGGLRGWLLWWALGVRISIVSRWILRLLLSVLIAEARWCGELSLLLRRSVVRLV